MSQIDDKISNILRHLRDRVASQNDYRFLSNYLKAILYKKRYIYFLAERDSEEERRECALELIQGFYTEVLIPKIDTLKTRAILVEAFKNYTIDQIRKRKDPIARLYAKVSKRLEELGYTPVSPESRIYAPKDWPPEQRNKRPASLDELMALGLPSVRYKAYKDDSKKADEIIATADLDNLINLSFEKIGKPINLGELSRMISLHIEGFPPVQIDKGLEEKEGEKRIEDSLGVSPIFGEEIRELITQKILPELDQNEQKCLYNWLVRELTLEEEAKDEGCSYQTISNRREKLVEKLANLLKEYHFSDEDQEIFGNIFMEELEKTMDPSFKSQ